MRILANFFLIILVITQLSCTSKVQTRYNVKIPKPQDENSLVSSETTTLVIVDQVQPEIKTNPPKQITSIPFDTIVIDITENSDIELSRANELFGNKDYKSALQLYINYLNSNSMRRSYFYWFTRLRIAECLYELSYLGQSEKELDEIRHSMNVPIDVIEKTLLLLYKMYCETNQKEKAQEVLLELKGILKEAYPKEIPPCKVE